MSPLPRRRPRQPPARLPEYLIHAIVKSLAPLPPLHPALPRALIADAEHHLRTVIRAAKAHMRHSHRSYMTTNDLALAYKSYSQQILPSLSNIHPPIQLLSLLYAPLPQNKYTYPVVSLLTLPNTPTLPLPTPIPIITPPYTIHQHSSLRDVINAIVNVVHQNARQGGSSNKLIHICVYVKKLVMWKGFEQRVWMHPIIRILLTCLLAKYLGKEHWIVRDVAAAVLQDIRENIHVNHQARIAKTLIAAITDSNSQLPTLYGAIRGISAFGKPMVQLQLKPLLPPLLKSLEAVTNQIQLVGPPYARNIEKAVENVCIALEEAVTNTPNV